MSKLSELWHYYKYVPDFILDKIRGTVWVKDATYEKYTWHKKRVEEVFRVLREMEKTGPNLEEMNSLFCGELRLDDTQGFSKYVTKTESEKAS